jgi:hypothetical protein
MTKSPKKPDEIEAVPDAWERFERAVDIGVKTPPMHREPPKPKRKKKPSKKED